eukprot:m.23933 g.23933  ORF g.23933 m.23933 type:complete len:54 (+) comp8544_c0_seq2:1048-1209(+)
MSADGAAAARRVAACSIFNTVMTMHMLHRCLPVILTLQPDNFGGIAVDMLFGF